ncbi:efflux RND transporter periplasmic adaptor subunit [Thermodesulfobacteriota bacterium]
MKKVLSAGLVLSVIIIGAHLLLSVHEDAGKGIIHKMEVSPSAYAAGETALGVPSGAPQPDNNEKAQTVEVEVPPESRRMMGIKTVAAAVRPLKRTVGTVGRVEFDETKLTTVNIKVDGWVEKLYADYTGKYVEKGEPLAEIYSPELLSVQLEYLNLLKWRPSLGIRSQRNMTFSLGDRTGIVGKLTMYDIDPLVDVVRQKLALWEIPEKLIKEIETKNQPIRTMTIESPVTGYVFQKPVFNGTRVAPGDKIFDIVDLSTVWVLADIYEYEIPFVKAGQNARITLSYYPRKEFLAKVDFVYPSFSGRTRTAKVRFVIPNPDLLLKPQMFADVEMALDLGKRLAIPEAAVLDTGKRRIVYVDTEDDFFSARQIKIGDRADGMVEVVSGLKQGEKVASSAVFLIDSEAKLRGVIQ